MSYRLASAPAAFVDLMNKVFERYVDKSVIIFINDFLVYLSTMEEHKMQLNIVLGEIEREKAICKVLKMGVWLRKVSFLGTCCVGRGNLCGSV